MGWECCPQRKEGLGKGVYTRFYLTTSKGAPPSKLLHFFTDKKKIKPFKRKILKSHIGAPFSSLKTSNFYTFFEGGG